MKLATLLLPLLATSTVATTITPPPLSPNPSRTVDSSGVISTTTQTHNPLPSPHGFANADIHASVLISQQLTTISRKLAAMERQFRSLETPPYPTDGASVHAQLENIYEGMWRIRRSIDDVTKRNIAEGDSKSVEGRLEKLENRHFQLYMRYVTWKKYVTRVLRYPVKEGMGGRVVRWIRKRVVG
jgi:hypothetical protein